MREETLAAIKVVVEEALAKIKEEKYNSLKAIFNAWMGEAGVPCVQVRLDYSVVPLLVFKVYTNRPGLMIGYRGELVNKYREKLKEYSRREVKIEFVETHKSFIFEKDMNETT